MPRFSRTIARSVQGPTGERARLQALAELEQALGIVLLDRRRRINTSIRSALNTTITHHVRARPTEVKIHDDWVERMTEEELSERAAGEANDADVDEDMMKDENSDHGPGAGAPKARSMSALSMVEVMEGMHDPT